MNRFEQFLYGAFFTALTEVVDGKPGWRVQIEGSADKGVARLLFHIQDHTFQITVTEV